MFHSPPTLWGISTVPGLLENFLVSVTPKWRIPTKKDVPQTAQSQDKRAGCRRPELCKITEKTHARRTWWRHNSIDQPPGRTSLREPSSKTSWYILQLLHQGDQGDPWTPQPHLRRYVERCTSFGGHRLAGRADIRNTENWKTSKNRRKGEKLILWKILKRWHLQPNYKFKVHLTSFVEVKGAVLTQESR